MNFIKGEVYFRLKFPDPEMLYPLIDSFVYIGVNLSDQDQEDSWYFQFADGYGKFGSVVDTHLGDRKVLVLKKEQLEEMFNTGSLVTALQSAKWRRNNPNKLE